MKIYSPENEAKGAGIIELNAYNSKIEFAAIGKKIIAYRSIGSGTPMILCARFRGNLDSWDPAFLDALAEKYTVIIFDYTGFGLSTGPLPETALHFAEDVRDLAAALGYEKIIVGGWSLGGWVAQIVVTEFTHLVSKAILIGTKPPGKVAHGIEQIFMDTAFKPYYTVEEETILFFDPASSISRTAAEESHDRIASRTGGEDKRIPEELWQFYNKCGEDFMNDPYNARTKITETRIPILVISADHEICFPPENWFELNRKLPTTQVIVIPRCGHGPHHQYPEMVAGYIFSFLENITYS